jgi:hypothetical protein
MRFDIPIAIAMMATTATARFCAGANIICTYNNNAGTCIVPCVSNCKCPPDWNNGQVTGHNIKSACGFLGAFNGRLQCFQD